MDRVLGNGLRLRMRYLTPSSSLSSTTPSPAMTSSVCLIVPAGENQEGAHRPQAAHACEHICCAFNGGFPKPYAFMSLKEHHGMRFRATTHADYTIYCLENVPGTGSGTGGGVGSGGMTGVEDAVKFIAGIFEPSATPQGIQKEMSVIRAEIQSGEPNEGLAWAYSYWLRQGDKRPTADAIIHRGITSLTPESAMSFHREWYVPSRCVCVVSTPASQGRQWDDSLMRYMSKPNSWMLPTAPTRPSPAICGSCAFLEGVWMVPSTRMWLICSRAFRIPPGGGSVGGSGDGYAVAETKARCLITACSRLSTQGENERTLSSSSSSHNSAIAEWTLMDYLRTNLGAAYHVSGSVLPVKDGLGESYCIAILTATLSRHLTRREAMECDAIVSQQCSRLPCRGALNNLVAWYVQNREGENVREGMSMLRIAPLSGGEPPLNWELVKRAHETAEVDSKAIIFSSAE
jgi:hypothetical protein